MFRLFLRCFAQQLLQNIVPDSADQRIQLVLCFVQLLILRFYTVSLLKPRLMCYNISGDENEEIRDNH